MLRGPPAPKLRAASLEVFHHAFCLLVILPMGLLALIAVSYSLECKSACEQRRYDEASSGAVQVACGDAAAGDGRLVYVSCDLNVDEATSIALPGAFSRQMHNGSGFRVAVEMYQCHEPTPGVYAAGWLSEWVDPLLLGDTEQKDKACGFVESPWWGDIAWLPQPEERMAENVGVGGFLVPTLFSHGTFAFNTQLTTVEAPSGVPGWKKEADGTLTTERGNATRIGDVRVRFYDVDRGKYTALGKNAGGKLALWTVGPCAPIGTMRPGAWDLASFVQELEPSMGIAMWVLRVFLMLLIWFVISRFAAPCGLTAERAPITRRGPEHDAFVVAICPALVVYALSAAVALLPRRKGVGVAVMCVASLACLALIVAGVWRRRVVAEKPPELASSSGTGIEKVEMALSIGKITSMDSQATSGRGMPQQADCIIVKTPTGRSDMDRE